MAQVSAAIMATHFPKLDVHCVTFGSPQVRVPSSRDGTPRRTRFFNSNPHVVRLLWQVGDCEFTDYVARKVNLRRVAYLGSGQLDIPEEHHLVYGALLACFLATHIMSKGAAGGHNGISSSRHYISLQGLGTL